MKYLESAFIICLTLAFSLFIIKTGFANNIIQDSTITPLESEIILLGPITDGDWQDLQIKYENLSVRNWQLQHIEDKLDRCIKKKTHTWYRKVGNTEYRGYSDELDRKWKRELYFKLLNGQKVC